MDCQIVMLAFLDARFAELTLQGYLVSEFHFMHQRYVTVQLNLSAI